MFFKEFWKTSLYKSVRLDFTFSQLLYILYECSWLRGLIAILASLPRRSQPTNLRAKNRQVKQLWENLTPYFQKVSTQTCTVLLQTNIKKYFINL